MGFPLGAQDSNDSSKSIDLFMAQIQGSVTVVSGGVSQEAVSLQGLKENDRVVTGKDGKAYLEFQNGGIVEVGPSTDATVSTLDVSGSDFKARFLLAWGGLKAKVKKLTGASSIFEINAGGVVAGVRGTIFGVDYDPAKKQVAAKTYEGSIFTQVGGKERIVNKGMSMLVDKTGIPLLGKLTGSDAASFKSFDSLTGQLEQKKQEMLNGVKEKARIHTGILPQKQENDLNDAIQKKLPF
jgi:hypothetical protein